MSRPASPAAAVAALTAMELRLVLRRGENLFATIVIPTLVLVLFSSISILPTGSKRPVDFLLPGAIALGIVATSLVSLGITTAYDRSYGVLKRLGGSPLSRAELVVARLLTVLVVEVVQIALLIGTATVVLGWTGGSSGSGSPLLFAIAVLLGTVVFAGLGLLLAGTLRAETVLALANILFLGFLVVGGIIVPIDRLPGPLEALAAALPAAPLAELFRDALAGSVGADIASPLALLAGWAIVAIGLAVTTFRWE
jgi:ABC-2 type transport system permease protein